MCLNQRLRTTSLAAGLPESSLNAMRSWILVALVAVGVLAVPGAASACACGGIVSPDVGARIADEVALLAGDGTTETIVMRLNMNSTADNAALVIPTPAPATVSAASPAVFDALEQLSAPRVETVRRWSFGAPPRSDLDTAASGALPTVVRQVRLGPLEATTLAGGELTGVRNWLRANGYALRPEILAGLDPYLRDGWSVVAMRLVGPGPLDGGLDPVRLSFASEKLVYPMRMSAQAGTPQRVVIYTLGEHRMQRVDPDAAGQTVTVDYAGSIAGRSNDPTLAELSRHGGYLTRSSTRVDDPAAITADFEFADAPSDEPYQRVIYRHEHADATPFVFGAGIAAVVLIGGVLLVVRRLR